MKKLLTASFCFILITTAINIFGLIRSYQSHGDLCPIYCKYRNVVGGEWITTEVFGVKTLWMNEKMKQILQEHGGLS